MTVKMKRDKPAGLKPAGLKPVGLSVRWRRVKAKSKAKSAAPAAPAAPRVIQDDLASSLILVLKQTEALFRQVLPVAEKMRDNTDAMTHLLHEQQRIEEYREDYEQHQEEAEESYRIRQADARQNSAESRLLEWFRKNAPEQLDPTGSTHLYDICLRIAAEWHRLRLEYRHQP